jgi:hypothetical protein
MSTMLSNAGIRCLPHATGNFMWNFCHIQDTALDVLF